MLRGSLGFGDFRSPPQSTRGVAAALHAQAQKADGALMRELKEVFRRHRSQPIERVINLINPVLRGWVNYFAVGHSSECFSFIKDWVEKKVRRQLAHAQKRERASAGDDGVSRGYGRTLSGCSTPIECDATGRKSPQQDRSHKPRHEANGGAQCGKSARCVRRGGGWKRGMVGTPRPRPARQSSTLPVRGSG